MLSFLQYYCFICAKFSEVWLIRNYFTLLTHPAYITWLFSHEYFQVSACCVTAAQPLGTRTLFACVWSLSDVAGYHLACGLNCARNDTAALFSPHCSIYAGRPRWRDGGSCTDARATTTSSQVQRRHTRYSQPGDNRELLVTYFPSPLQLPQQPGSCQLFPCADLDWSHPVKIYVVLRLFPKHVV